MKNLTLFLIIFLTNLSLFSQNRQDYYVVVKPNYSLEPNQRTVNQDQTLTLDLQDNNLETFFNSKPVYYIDKAFPTAISPYLQRVYRITLDNNTHLGDIFNRSEIEYVELLGEEEFLYTPDDFDGLDGNPMTQLDLIKARRAWDTTQGDSNIIVGIVDTYFETTHEDLTNQILQNLDNDPPINHHGTKVAGFVAAQTDNDIGVAGIGFDTKLITMAYSNIPRTEQMVNLSQIPGVKVVNGSWHNGTCDFSPVEAAAYEEMWNNGVIPIFAAGNGSTCSGPNNYVYPAAYDHTIAVSSVGHVYPVGTNHPTLGKRDWKDVHEKFIGDPNSTHQHNDKVDIVAPGYHMTSTSNGNSYFDNGNGTSYASPTVAGVVALMLAVNPNLTPDEVRNILKDTADDIYQIPENAPYIGLLGEGRVNSYAAVLTAQCMANPSTGLDLVVKNSEEDKSDEPDIDTEFLWRSTDIWVRNQNDGKYNDTHQNPEYDINDPNYAYVRVANNSCETSSGNDVLKLYWAKANTSLAWPQHWDGSLFISDPITNEDVIMGDEIATITIPPLHPGQCEILEFEWNVPNPEDYTNINANPWHFCLLARMESTDDPMTFPEVSSIGQNVKNNNNIAWKNTTVVDIIEDSPSPIGGVVAVGNPFNQQKLFTLEIRPEQNELGKAIYDEAEVSIEMDDVFYDAWVRGG